ncbi:hypothetical protein [Micromonospora fulviviridis]|uniref:Uncharacterized protein n=1 Tax=Micromonospora fulviviridis TaxID=47860 RepID=A0ABV2VC21_9ACTN
MRRGSVVLGGAMAAAGVVVVGISVAFLVREIARSPDWDPNPLLGVAAGALLVLLGVGLARDQRRFPAGYRADDGPAVLFPYTPPQPETGDGHMPSYDCGSGGDAGGGGGDCGGGGGGS